MTTHNSRGTKKAPRPLCLVLAAMLYLQLFSMEFALVNAALHKSFTACCAPARQTSNRDRNSTYADAKPAGAPA